MKMHSRLAACAGLLGLATVSAYATPIPSPLITITSLTSLTVTGAGTPTVSNVSSGDWTIANLNFYVYSSLKLEFASPDFGGPGANVYLTTPQGGGPITVLISNTAPQGFDNNCGSNPSNPVADGTSCGIGYTSSYAAVTGTLQEVAPVAVTPEPSSIALLGTGILALAETLRRRSA